MKVELPEFKRCCCCLPLRYGLIGAGYIKLGVTLLVLLYILYTLLFFSMIMMAFGVLIPQIIVLVLIALLLILDIAMTIMFLIGGHKKSVRLLNIFYIYSIVALCVSTLLFAVSTGFELYFMSRYTSQSPNGKISFTFMVQTEILFLIVFFGVGVYVILLVRSEIRKLRNSHSFRFVNIANEAQCAMGNGINEYSNETDDLKNGFNDPKNKINHVDRSESIDDRNGTIGQKNGIDSQSEDIPTNYPTKEADPTFNYTKL